MTAVEIAKLVNAEEDLVNLCTKELVGMSITDVDTEDITMVQSLLKYIHAHNQLLIQMANTIDLLDCKLDRLAKRKEES